MQPGHRRVATNRSALVYKEKTRCYFCQYGVIAATGPKPAGKPSGRGNPGARNRSMQAGNPDPDGRVVTRVWADQEAGMDIIKIRFAAEFEELSSDIERTIEDMFRSLNPVFSLTERCWKPSMDMNETPEQIIILAEVAGVDKDDLEVEISSKAVRIRAMRPARNWGADATYRLAEIQYGRFERVLFLPAPIDPEIVSAAYTNGMLEIRLAKLPLEAVRNVPVTEA
jgi:HSP20 family protein